MDYRSCLICGERIGTRSHGAYGRDPNFCRACRPAVKRVREQFRRAGVVPSHEMIARAVRVRSEPPTH